MLCAVFLFYVRLALTHKCENVINSLVAINKSRIFKGDDNRYYEKIGKDAPVDITDELIFVDVPSTWELIRLSELCTMGMGQTILTKEMKKSGIPVYSATMSDEPLGYIESSINRIKLTKNDLVIPARGNSIGYVTLVKDIEASCTQTTIYAKFYKGFYVNYLYYFMKAYKDKLFVNNGSAIPQLTISEMSKIIIPFPPLAEQERIVQVMQLVDEYVRLATRDKELDDKIKTFIKQFTLQQAIQGKLVEQDANDEPASLLLERIRTEKGRLVRAGKIRKDKIEFYTSNVVDNCYYGDLPSSWAISTLSAITNNKLLNDGDWILSENMDVNGAVKLIQLGSIGFMEYINKGFKYITESTFTELSCTQIFPSYLLINRIISDKMCACILPSIEGKLITTVDTCWIAPKPDQYELEYLLLVLSSPQFQSLVLQNATGTTRKRISKNNLIALPIPIPPLAEQKRIVEKVKEIFAKL